ncbi:MAG: DNA polymerase IV [Acidobacteria bacterium]|nr:DNA polymerase IV [Acidobacteriota bacterium]
MDAFYASVEQRDQPHLKGKPVVVGGSPQGRGVVAAASYEARAFGIRSAMSAFQAVRLCPQAVFIRPRFQAYKEVSQQIRAIFLNYTDLMEPLSLDEAYLDVTQNKANIPSATWVAEAIRRDIFQATRLTASAGVAPNKFLAKVASDVNKPNGICVIRPEEAVSFVASLPIGRFHGIGKATEARMLGLGIEHGAHLRERSQTELIQLFGKIGSFYYQIARGEDPRPVRTDYIRKSVSSEETYQRDLYGQIAIDKELLRLSEEVSRRLARAKAWGKTVHIKVRFPDFTSVTRSASASDHHQEAHWLAEHAIDMVRGTPAYQRGVRLLGVGVSNLLFEGESDHGIQLWLPFQ